MARKKDKIMAFEVISPDPLHPHNDRVCRNFVCYSSNVRKCLEQEVRKPEYMKDPTITREMDILTGYQTEARDGLGNLSCDLVSLTPAVLEKTVKSTTEYIYRTRDYSTHKPGDCFGTRKDALSLIQKRIKTKNVIIHYNGITEKCEFNVDALNDIFSKIEEDTVELDIAPLGRNDVEGEIILVTIYKNLL